MHLNKIGKIVEKAWLGLPDHYPDIDVEHFIIMPNHLHGLVEIKEAPRRGGFLNPPLQKAFGLTEIIRGFKTWSAREVNSLRNTKGVPLWQRSFYDKIIRDEKQLFTILEYIRYNPQRWADDEENI
jgi:REP element-mobilizing transposase RayT